MLVHRSASLTGWELGFTSMICACYSHTRATEPTWTSQPPTLYLHAIPSMLLSRKDPGERKLAFIFILATKYLCYFKQGTFSIFCFKRILDSVSEPRTFSPSTIYQGALWWWRPHALFLFSQKDFFSTSLSISMLSLLSVSLFPLKTQVIVHKVLTRTFCVQIKSFTLFLKFFFFFLFNSSFFSFLPLHLSLRPLINLLPIPPFYPPPGMTLIPSFVDCFPGLMLTKPLPLLLVQVLNFCCSTVTYRMDKQQDPTVQRRELCSISCDKP